MPGQNPAQQQMQQQRQRQMEYAWWKEHQQQAVPAPFDTRPGFFVRFILGVISLVLFAVVVVALIGAAWAVKDGMPQYVAVSLGVAVVAGMLRRAVRRRAKGR
jgi:hypothetical protein